MMRKNAFMGVAIFVYCLLILYWPCDLVAQLWGVRGRAYKPSESLGTFRANLGSRRLSTFREYSYGLSNIARYSGSSAMTGLGSYGSFNVRPSRPNYTTPGLITGWSMMTGRYDYSSLYGGVNLQAGSYLSSGSDLGVSPGIDIGNMFASSYGLGGILGSFILIPREEMSTEEEDLLTSQASSTAAFEPLLGEDLQRPNLNAPRPEDAPVANKEGSESDRTVLSDRFSNSSLYVAQQISRARSYIKEGQYEQALVCYKAANFIEPQNIQSLVGIIFSYIMQKRPLAAGLEVERLIRYNPDFWMDTPDYISYFGLDKFSVDERLETALAEIDYLIDINSAEDSETARKNLVYLYLDKIFVGWLRADRDYMMANINEAASRFPFEPAVQSIYRSITGKGLDTIKTTELAPLQ